MEEQNIFGIHLENVIKAQEIQHIRSSISTNIVTILGASLLYGIYQLAGEFLDTFIFTFLFAISLSTIKKKFLHKMTTDNEGKKQYYASRRIFQLNTTRHSIFFKGLIIIFQNVSSIKALNKNLKYLLTMVIDATIIPYIFLIYVLCIKLSFSFEILLLDMIFWIGIDLLTGIGYLWRRFLGIIRRLKSLSPMKQVQKEQVEDLHFLLKIDNYGILNNCFFCLLIIGIILAIPIMVILCMNDLQQFKANSTPVIYSVLQRYNLTEINIEEYMKPEFVISRLEGLYITPEMAEKLYDYSNRVQKQEKDEFVSILFGEKKDFIDEKLRACDENWYCFIQVVGENYEFLNSDIHLLLRNLSEYFQDIAPKIKGFLLPILSSLSRFFQGSMGFIFKFTLFYQGVLYLLNESKMRMSDLVFLNLGEELREQFSKSINQHISGVFEALSIIFIYHFMLSYILMDFIEAQLSFIISILIAVLSLTQLISPFLFFLIVITIQFFTGLLASSFNINQSVTFIELVVSCIIFFFESSQIYSTSFTVHFGDPFWIGISVILGYISFQWKGIVYGPLLISFIKALGSLLQIYLKEKNQKIPNKNKETEDQKEIQKSKQQQDMKKKSKI